MELLSFIISNIESMHHSQNLETFYGSSFSDIEIKARQFCYFKENYRYRFIPSNQLGKVSLNKTFRIIGIQQFSITLYKHFNTDIEISSGSNKLFMGSIILIFKRSTILDCISLLELIKSYNAVKQ